MNYSKIIKFFDTLTRDYGLYICIKDFLGFLPMSPDSAASFQPYLAHVNPFCLYMKTDKHVYKRCVSMINGMHKRFQDSSDSFCGSCHVGLTEHVIPIMRDNQIFGSINIGFFNENKLPIKERLVSICEDSKLLEHEIAVQLLENTITPTANNFPIDFLLPTFEIIAEYLACTYPDIEKIESGELKHNSNEDTILSHALVYIKDNLTTRIYVEDVAEFCLCSTSYLSHIFKKRIKLSINAYITSLRVELAKNYLHNTTMSIASIAHLVGFEDPNYFSRHFTKATGFSPKQFRTQYV